MARVFVLCLLTSALPAQQAAVPPALTIAEAVETAIRTYPAVAVSQAQIDAAAAGIQLARTSYLPRLDGMAQANRATRNNIFGQLLPQSVIPSMSGPALGTNNLGTAWGSAVGALATWEPYDFGRRDAGVAAATAERTHSEAALKRTQFEIGAAAADACMTLAAAEETVKAAQSAVTRAESISRTTHALVNADLRPGADASRADAETAAARTQLVRAQQAVDVSRASLSRFLGRDPAQVAVASAKLTEPPPHLTAPPLDAAANPLSVEQNAVVEQVKAQLKILERSYFPRFALQAAAYSRGSGAQNNGTNLGGVNGLAPNTQNYAVGFTVTFPVFDRASIRAREAQQSAAVRAETARYEQIAGDLKAQWNAAVAGLDGAWRVAENTPVQVAAARAATTQATARYQSGLGNIDEVAEAQRLLAQSEIDDALARLGVWRGLLGVAVAAGDLRPFLAEASR